MFKHHAGQFRPDFNSEQSNFSLSIVMTTFNFYLLQPAVSLNIKLKESPSNATVGETRNFLLDLKTFEELRFCVAKSLGSTDQYRVK